MSQETNMAMIAAIPTVPRDKLGVKYYAACPCGGVIAAWRTEENGHLRARCPRCGFRLIE